MNYLKSGIVLFKFTELECLCRVVWHLCVRKSDAHIWVCMCVSICDRMMVHFCAEKCK